MTIEEQQALLNTVIFTYRYLFSWLIPCLYVVGCSGTLICIVVLLRKHSTQREVRPWFIALSIVDIYVLSISLPIMYLDILMVTHKTDVQSQNVTESEMSFAIYKPRTWSMYNCYGITMLQYYGLLTSSWVQAGISTLRCLSVIIPLTSRHKVDLRRSVRALAATLAIPIAIAVAVAVSTVQYSSTVSDMYYPDSNKTVEIVTSNCTQKNNSKYYFHSTFILRAALPSVALIVSTTVILHSLHRFKRAFHSERGRRSLQQRRVSFILIGMNTTFLLFVTPYEVYMIIASEMRHVIENSTEVMLRLKIVEYSLALLMYANNATNWIFYFVLGKRFRQEIHRRTVCGSCCRTHEEPTDQYRIRTPKHQQPNHHSGDKRRGNYDIMELQPLHTPESPIADVRQTRSLEAARSHAGHRVCHVDFHKLSSV